MRVVPAPDPSAPDVTFVVLGDGVFTVTIANAHLLSQRGLELFGHLFTQEEAHPVSIRSDDGREKLVYVIDLSDRQSDDTELSMQLQLDATRFLVAPPRIRHAITHDGRPDGQGYLTVTFGFEWGAVTPEGGDNLRSNLTKELADIRRGLAPDDAFEYAAAMTVHTFAGVPTNVTLTLHVDSNVWQADQAVANTVLETALKYVVSELTEVHRRYYCPA